MIFYPVSFGSTRLWRGVSRAGLYVVSVSVLISNSPQPLRAQVQPPASAPDQAAEYKPPPPPALEQSLTAAPPDQPSAALPPQQPAYSPPAQPPGPAPAAAQGYPPEQLEAILAPIALYPDDLLTQVLMASAYPLQIVEAERWLDNPANTDLRGEALMAALAPQDWDPSVKSLVPFPQVLAMMNTQLQWTQQLGYAVELQQPAVIASIQCLRKQAEIAGALHSTPQEVVRTENGAIIIAPAQPDMVYVPAYNPSVVYGAWPYPAYPPVYLPPPPGDYFGTVLAAGLAFGVGVAVVGGLWGWARPNWRGNNVSVDVNRFNAINVNRPPVANPDWRPGAFGYRSPAAGAGGGFVRPGVPPEFAGARPAAPSGFTSARPAGPPVGGFRAPVAAAPRAPAPPAGGFRPPAEIRQGPAGAARRPGAFNAPPPGRSVGPAGGARPQFNSSAFNRPPSGPPAGAVRPAQGRPVQDRPAMAMAAPRPPQARPAAPPPHGNGREHRE